MRTAVEQMIKRLIGIGSLVGLGVVFGVTGLMASEYDFAPIEALQMAEELDSQQSFTTSNESHWNTSQGTSLVESAPIGSCCAKCGSGVCCPPDWYWEQNVRVLSRCKPEQTV